MRIPLSWLRDYVALDMPVAELAERLAISTCEVERVLRRGVSDADGNFGRYLVGRVVEAGKHPNADRLQLCHVDVGEAEPRQIVCGAWNFGAGATVAVALPGAVLPDGRRLERAKLRGSLSDGMILSERELELGADHAGIVVLPEGPEPGTPLADILPLGEDVLEIEVTGNRPDLLSMYGVAREVAALFGLELAPPPGHDPTALGDETPQIDIDDLVGCPRYIGRLFRDVRLGPSPPWLRVRLVASGMRPISNVVDVTNYVMLVFGSPLHAFDLERLAGGGIGVRRARVGEELRTLDGALRALDPADLLITDGARPIALAGIMGGEESEVTNNTTSVLLEAANFEPVGILRTSERLALRTESSNRWEKGVDPHIAGLAAVLATELLVELAAARWTGGADVKGDLPSRPVVAFRPERASKLSGLDVPANEQRALLERLGFEVGSDWTVTVPTWRARDVTREADVVEEIARIHMAEVPFTLPERRAMFGRLSKDQRLRRVVEDVLAGCGLSETYTSSLVASDPNPNALRLPEPLTVDQAILRTTLLTGLVEAARVNMDAGNPRIALFEMARIYDPVLGGQLPDERWHLGGLIDGGYSRAKGVVETLYGALHVSPLFVRTHASWLHPAKAAAVNARRAGVQEPAGWVGELHPSLLDRTWGVFEIDLAVFFAGIPDRILYQDVISFPALRQDLAFVVDVDVSAGELEEAAREAAGEELREIRFLSDYRGAQIPEGKKSLAFRVTFQSDERTLSDDDARILRERIVAALAERFGAELRA